MHSVYPFFFTVSALSELRYIFDEHVTNRKQKMAPLSSLPDANTRETLGSEDELFRRKLPLYILYTLYLLVKCTLELFQILCRVCSKPISFF